MSIFKIYTVFDSSLALKFSPRNKLKLLFSKKLGFLDILIFTWLITTKKTKPMYIYDYYFIKQKMQASN